MTSKAAAQVTDPVRLRELAQRFDCMTEDDFRQLANITPSTALDWRKRRRGPAFIRLGNQVFYPNKAVQSHMEMLTRERLPTMGMGKSLL